MSLSKLKKDELVALAISHSLTFDADWTKAEIIEELEAAGIEAPNDGGGDAGEAVEAVEGRAHLSKAERTAQLNSR